MALQPTNCLTFAILLGLLLVPASAQAACTIKSYNGINSPHIIRSGKSSEYHGYLRELAKGNSQVATLLATTIACIVPIGTRVMITDAGIMSHTVTVVSGEEIGCAGDIATEFLKCD